jgi:hypothetical protein
MMNPLNVKKSGMPTPVIDSQVGWACPNAIVKAATNRRPVSASIFARETVIKLIPRLLAASSPDQKAWGEPIPRANRSTLAED